MRAQTVTCLFISKPGKISVRLIPSPVPEVVEDPPVPTGAVHACRALGIAVRRFKRTTDGSMAVYEEM